MMGRILRFSFLLNLATMCVLVSGCSSPTASTLPIRIQSIRYERVHPPDTSRGGRVMLNMSIPFPDGSGRSDINFCFLAAVGDQVFVCENVGWDVPVGEECWVSIDDPAVGRQTARAVFVNGQRVGRVDVTSNRETGRFRFDARGQLF
jgi:hypothetical protein